jgi:hypothetical protein
MAFLSSNSLQDLPIGLGEFGEFVRSRNGPLATYATHMTHILEISTTCSTVNFEHFESSCQPTVQLTATGTTGTTGITLTWAPGNQIFDGFLLHPKACLAVFDIRRQGEHHWDPGGLFECGKSKYFYSRDKRLARGQGCIVCIVLFAYLFANKAL